MGANGTLYKKKANDQYIYTDNRIKMMFVLNPDFRKLGAPDHVMFLYNQLATAHTRTVKYTHFAMDMTENHLKIANLFYFILSSSNECSVWP